MRYECTGNTIIGHTFDSTDCAADTEEEVNYTDDPDWEEPLADGTPLGCSVATFGMYSKFRVK